MKYRKLASTGTSVSNLALCAMELGTKVDENDSFALLDRFVEAGGTLVDTADVYSAGVAQEIVGRWYADRPTDVTERVVLATKGRFPTGTEPNAQGTSRRHLTRVVADDLHEHEAVTPRQRRHRGVAAAAPDDVDDAPVQPLDRGGAVGQDGQDGVGRVGHARVAERDQLLVRGVGD